MIEAYRTNRPLRAAFLRMNRVRHAEIWDTENGYQVALCSDFNVGFRESPEFATPGQCVGWCKKYCPELEIIG